MLSGMYLSTAGALVEEIRQDVIANNLANLGTSGFKADTAIFRARLNEALEGPGTSRFEQDALLENLGGGVFLDEVAFSSEPGPLTSTGNLHDLALDGDGFFVVAPVDEPAGGDGTGAATTRLYTRDGRFRRAEDGSLVTVDGRYRLLGRDGEPLRVGAGEMRVTRDGEVRAGDAVAGRIAVAGSLDTTRFEKVGSALYRYLGTGEPEAAMPAVVQGFVEGSTVSPVREMVRLIQSHRAYEANMQMIRMQDGTLQRAVNDLGQLA